MEDEVDVEVEEDVIFNNGNYEYRTPICVRAGRGFAFALHTFFFQILAVVDVFGFIRLLVFDHAGYIYPWVVYLLVPSPWR